MTHPISWDLLFGSGVVGDMATFQGIWLLCSRRQGEEVRQLLLVILSAYSVLGKFRWFKATKARLLPERHAAWRGVVCGYNRSYNQTSDGCTPSYDTTRLRP